MNNVEEEIHQKIIDFFSESKEFDIYEKMHFYYHKKNMKCNVQIDKLDNKYGSPNISDCENISKQLKKYLRNILEENNIYHSFFLQISSPGAERQLKTINEWERFQSLPFKVKYYLEDNTLDVQYLNYKGLKNNQTQWMLADIKKNKNPKNKANDFLIPKENLKKVSLYLDI